MVNDAVRILVAEDEPHIQRFIEDALSDGGFEADVARSGEEAVSRFDDGRSDYRALVTDINIGAGLNGWELARKVREIDPGMTGAHAGNPWAFRTAF